ncbi:MAG: hypothetical protein ABW023_09485 [Sphingomonas sp.]
MATLVLIFAISLLVNSQALVGSTHQRNSHGLEIIASGLEGWPATARQIASVRKFDQNDHIGIRHPDFGDLQIDRVDCGDIAVTAARERFFPTEARPGQGPLFKVSGTIDRSDKCFTARAPLEMIAGISRSGSRFSNIVLVTPDQTVIEQLGSAKLPIAKLPNLSPVNGFARSLVSGVFGGGKVDQTGPTGLDSSPGASRIQIADTAYYAYVQPIRIADASQRICPGAKPIQSNSPQTPTAPTLPASTSRAPADTDANQATAAPQPRAPGSLPNSGTSTSDGGCQFYIVGLMPNQALRTAWISPPALVLTGFSLLLLIVMALLPVARLLLIGSSESIGPIELVGILFGTYAATAIVTLLVLFAYETANERHRTTRDGEAAAVSLANKAADEINSLASSAIYCRTSPVPPPPETKAPLPRIFEAGWFDAMGGYQVKACGIEAFSTSVDIGARPYFKELKDPDAATPDGNRLSYVLAEVHSQTDGVKKTVLVLGDNAASRPNKPQPAEEAASATKPPSTTPNPPPPTTEEDKAPRYLLVSTFMKSLAQPLLPWPQKFMVVDTGDPRLPVLFHSEPGRALMEEFATQIDRSGEIGRALRQMKPAELGKFSFSRRYDGEVTTFSVARISGTRWAILVFHTLDEVDQIAARTATRALTAWAGVSVILMVVTVCFILYRKQQWRRLWPSPHQTQTYRDARIIAALAIAIAIWALFIGPWAVPIAVGIGIMVCLSEFRRLGSKGGDEDKLTSETEHAYRLYVLSMLACVAIAPMIAFWADARAFSRDLVDQYRIDRAATGLKQESERVAALQQMIASSDRIEFDAKGAAVKSMDLPVPQVFNPAGKKTRPVGSRADLNWTVAGLARHLQTGLPQVRVQHCLGGENWYCWTDSNAPNIADHIGVKPRDVHRPTAIAMLLILTLALGGAALICTVVFQSLQALTGFGIPLNAVTWPTLVLSGTPNRANNELALARKSMLVAPQQAVRDAVNAFAISVPVDLAAELLPIPESLLNLQQVGTVPAYPTPWTQLPQNRPPRLVITGLELVLRSPVRRRAALAYLERAVEALAPGSANPIAGIVLIAEMSPLERILDAFDAQSESDDSQDRTSWREELRWARLFQDFSTFSFAPIDKIDWKLVHANTLSGLSIPARKLANELRWLPGSVIDGVIADSTSRTILTSTNQKFPVDSTVYQGHYTDLIVEWARAVNPVSESAAVDFLRSNLIEYYEQCWAASSLSERFVLDAVARGAFVNMRKSIALQSLVRRGLVILDPTPRLMNESFALFILQTERPDSLQAWRERQPPSTWANLRMPLAIGIPVAILFLAFAAAESGQELTAAISLIAAGSPALLGSLLRPKMPS